MKIGLVLPMGSHSSTPEPYPAIRRFAIDAEEVGFDSLWAFDHVLFRMPGEPERGALEPWTIMSLLGEATRGLVSALPGVNLIVYGGLLVLMIMFLPRGIIGLLKCSRP